jgi:hypothetical protein
MLKSLAKDKHSSLFIIFISDEEQKDCYLLRRLKILESLKILWRLKRLKGWLLLLHIVDKVLRSMLRNDFTIRQNKLDRSCRANIFMLI